MGLIEDFWGDELPGLKGSRVRDVDPTGAFGPWYWNRDADSYLWVRTSPTFDILVRYDYGTWEACFNGFYSPGFNHPCEVCAYSDKWLRNLGYPLKDAPHPPSIPADPLGDWDALYFRGFPAAKPTQTVLHITQDSEAHHVHYRWGPDTEVVTVPKIRIPPPDNLLRVQRIADLLAARKGWPVTPPPEAT